MRHSAASETKPADPRHFAKDVGYYLSLTPRQLPSYYLYDDLGSALFEAICQLPWYPITRAELALLEAHRGEILAHVEPLTSLVELGPGSGLKLATLVAAARFRHSVTTHLIDVSEKALDAATRALEVHPRLRLVPHRAGYEEGLAAFATEWRAPGRTVVLCLGSNLGNFDRPYAETFLRHIRACVAPGDFLLIGLDLVKPEAELLLAYDDPLGVTAAFNRNLLVRINRELDADFDVSAFSHRAVWNAAASRVEMHLVSARPQTVRVRKANVTLSMGAGETIWTESSYKYRLDEVDTLLRAAGFAVADRWTHANFALTLAKGV
jgi:dimethylhistidine N-methyltransferase